MRQSGTLVYHAGALGDFITVLPFLRAWRLRHPGAALVLLSHAAHGALARAAGYAEAAWDLADARHCLLFAPDTDASALEYASGFDAAIAFADAASPLLRSLARAGIPHILHQPPFPTDRQHVVDHHLSLLGDIPLAEADRIPSVRIGADADPPALPPRTALLHPGSGSKRKNWPLERFVALAAELHRRHFEPTWLLGPAEDALELPAGHRTLRSPSLVNLAATLAEASLYIGNDSGVSHLAAATGCPTIALFGPSDPAVWAPRGPNVRIVSAPHIRDLTVDAALAAARAVTRHSPR